MFFQKQPSETFSIGIDFEDVLEDDETISSKVVSAIKIPSGTDATSLIIESSAISTTSIIVKVKNGSDKDAFKITVKITTSKANVFEEDILMNVVEE